MTVTSLNSGIIERRGDSILSSPASANESTDAEADILSNVNSIGALAQQVTSQSFASTPEIVKRTIREIEPGLLELFAFEQGCVTWEDPELVVLESTQHESCLPERMTELAGVADEWEQRFSARYNRLPVADHASNSLTREGSAKFRRAIYRLMQYTAWALQHFNANPIDPEGPPRADFLARLCPTSDEVQEFIAVAGALATDPGIPSRLCLNSGPECMLNCISSDEARDVEHTCDPAVMQGYDSRDWLILIDIPCTPLLPLQPVNTNIGVTLINPDEYLRVILEGEEVQSRCSEEGCNKWVYVTWDRLCDDRITGRTSTIRCSEHPRHGLHTRG